MARATTTATSTASTSSLSSGVKQMTLLAGVVAGLLLSMSLARVETQRLLCGKTLADTLDLVCTGRGFYFNKRTDDVLKETDTLAKDSAGRAKRNSGGVRSVVDECCRRPCTYSVLESYCAPADDSLMQLSPEHIQRMLDRHNSQQSTLTSTVYTTTQSTAHLEANSPTAEVHRGPGGVFRRPGQSFFYVRLGAGARPTRSPLVVSGNNNNK